MSDLDGYEKGVAARVLLEKLIKQGRLAASPDNDEGVDLVIPLRRWQLEMLAAFSEGASHLSAHVGDLSQRP